MPEEARRILVVEDAPNWLKMYKDILEGMDDVISAASVLEAKRALAEEGITHLITDGLEGGWADVIDAAKESGVENIVIVSGRDLKSQAEQEGVRYVDRTDLIMGKVNIKDLPRVAEWGPVEIEMRQFGEDQSPRACVMLDNGLLLALPSSIRSWMDMGEYEYRTIEALETDEGLEFVLSQVDSKYEVHLPIGENWNTTASVKKHNGEVVFFLYHGAN